MLSTTVQYGIIIINGLKHTDELIASSRIANIYNLSPTFVDQIIRKLRNAGIVKSFRGPGGGYKLIKQDVTMQELIDLLSARHKIHPVVENAHENVVKALSNVLV